MKIVIIGGVAAGTSAAAKARRNDEAAEIRIFDRDTDISYSGCGLPYYIGTEIEERQQLVPRDAKFFKKKYNVDIVNRHDVTAINPQDNSITVKNLENGEVFAESYDKLVIATGARAVIPNIDGVDKANVFYLRNVASADSIRQYALQQKPKSAVIIGSGFIGLEMAENLAARGIEVTVVEMAAHVMPVLDEDMAVYLADHLDRNGINVIERDSVIRLEGETAAEKVVLAGGRRLETGLVIVAAGVKPNVELAKSAGIVIGDTGAIQVNAKMQTSIENIYACGDCAESWSRITQKPLYRPLGSTANKMGRIAGDQITGGTLEFRGILGTGICKVLDLTVAQTGLTEEDAKQAGYDVVVCHSIKPDKPEYFHGQEMILKALADRVTGRLLGAQIIGKAGVDKRNDVFVTAITYGAKAEDLFHLDLAYAPPFSTTKDPVMYAGMILDNALHRGRQLITPGELLSRQENGDSLQIIDVRAEKQYLEGHVPGAVHMPPEQLRSQSGILDKDKPTVTYCNKGVTGNAAQNILINQGFREVYNLSGGYKNFVRAASAKRKKRAD